MAFNNKVLMQQSSMSMRERNCIWATRWCCRIHLLLLYFVYVAKLRHDRKPCEGGGVLNNGVLFIELGLPKFGNLRGGFKGNWSWFTPVRAPDPKCGSPPLGMELLVEVQFPLDEWPVKIVVLPVLPLDGKVLMSSPWAVSDVLTRVQILPWDWPPRDLALVDCADLGPDAFEPCCDAAAADVGHALVECADRGPDGIDARFDWGTDEIDLGPEAAEACCDLAPEAGEAACCDLAPVESGEPGRRELGLAAIDNVDEFGSDLWTSSTEFGVPPSVLTKKKHQTFNIDIRGNTKYMIK